MMTCHIYVSKNTGDKITSSYPSKNYGRITIISKYRTTIKNKFLVSTVFQNQSKFT